MQPAELSVLQEVQNAILRVDIANANRTDLPVYKRPGAPKLGAVGAPTLGAVGAPAEPVGGGSAAPAGVDVYSNWFEDQDLQYLGHDKEAKHGSRPWIMRTLGNTFELTIKEHNGAPEEYEGCVEPAGPMYFVEPASNVKANMDEARSLEMRKVTKLVEIRTSHEKLVRMLDQIGEEKAKGRQNSSISSLIPDFSSVELDLEQRLQHLAKETAELEVSELHKMVCLSPYLTIASAFASDSVLNDC